MTIGRASRTRGLPVPVVEAAKGIFRIGPLDTFTRETPATTPYVVVGDKHAAILEFGEVGQAPALLQAIRQIGVSFDRIAYIMASHIHLHHIGGVNFLLKEIPHAKLVIHQRGAPHVAEPTRLNASTLQVWGESSGCPQISPVPMDSILPVSGGEVFDLGGRELEIIETLGHAPHHISIFDRLSKVMFAGDAAGVLRMGSERCSPDIRPPLFEMEAAAESLQRLRAFNPSAIFLFGYGGVSHSPDKTLQWSEEDIRAVEAICREGMQQKLSNKVIGEKVRAYYRSVGITMEADGPQGGADRGMAPIGMIAYVKKNHPELELPL